MLGSGLGKGWQHIRGVSAQCMPCRGTMLRCALLGVLLGVASAVRQQAQIDCTSIEAARKRLQPDSASADAAVRLQRAQHASGSANSTRALQECNPNLPKQGPPVEVPDIQPAPWHAIARPPNATCAVSCPALVCLQPKGECTLPVLHEAPSSAKSHLCEGSSQALACERCCRRWRSAVLLRRHGSSRGCKAHGLHSSHGAHGMMAEHVA